MRRATIEISLNARRLVHPRLDGNVGEGRKKDRVETNASRTPDSLKPRQNDFQSACVRIVFEESKGQLFMDERYIPAVSEDGDYFPIEKLQAHVSGTFHLAISIFVFERDRLLMQRRALGKYHSGGLWTNTVCTHPHWNETVSDAAQRRLVDELGFSIPLERAGTIDYHADVGSGLIEHERVSLFTGHADASALIIRPNPEEVMDYRWMTMKDVRELVSDKPDQVTEWMKIYIEELVDLFPK